MPTIKLIVIVLLLLPVFCFSQTGPAGVGNSSSNKIWLDAASLTGLTNGQSVSSWTDRSGNGWNAIQNSAANKPVYLTNQLNGYPAIVFNRNPVPQMLEITNTGMGMAWSNSNTIYVVSKGTTGGSGTGQGFYQVVFTTGIGYINGILYTGSPTLTRTQVVQYTNGDGASPAGQLGFSSITTQNTWQITTQRNDEFSGGTVFRSYINGMNQSGSSSPYQMAEYGNYNSAKLGAYSTSGYMCALNGAISEVIMFTFALNDPQRIIVDNYLAAKYGLTISNDFYSGNDVAFVKDLVGIGTTNGTTYKHSMAQNGKGLVLSERNGSLNAANEFVMGANAFVDNGTVFSDIPSSVAARWQRNWYIKKTGAVDVALGFDIGDSGSELNPAQLNLSSLSLLYRSATTGNFNVVLNGGTPVVPALLNGDQITFELNNAQLLDGYYTLGHGAMLTWTGNQNTEWANPLNWSPNKVPGPLDHVMVNTCNTCPALSSSASVGSLVLTQGSRINLANSSLVIEVAGNLLGATVVSSGGRLQATDFVQIQDSVFQGAVKIEKFGGGDNACYGGNSFDPQVTFFNSSNRSWTLSAQADNTVQKQ